MTFESAEISVSDSRPVELFDFAMGATHWRYTSAADDEEYLGNNFEAQPIRRTKFSADATQQRSELSITAGRNNVFARLFINAPLEAGVSLTIYRRQGIFYANYWLGQVSNISFSTKESTILCKPTLGAVNRLALRRQYGRQCPYDVYGTGTCTVLKSGFQVSGTVATISGVTVTGAAFGTKPDGWFNGGFITIGDASRMIKTHVTTTITMSHAMYEAAAGNSFDAYAGCDKTRATCIAKFLNGINYGGQSWMPEKNPSGGDPIV